MNKEFPAHWLVEIVEEILERNTSLITLSTGKTPSGHIHIGILREIIICDALRRIFENADKMVRFFLFLDSLDAAKRFPHYINEEFGKQHRGKPFSLIPCPFDECGCQSYAHHFGNELISTFADYGIETEVIWTHELYQDKKMQEKIKIALDNTNEIKEILKKYILPTLDEDKKTKFIEMQENWMPVMVICEKCDKIQHVEKDGSIKPNRAKDYLEKEEKVSYKCPACNHSGKISIYSGRLKLNWRVDWPAKWAIFKTTCEPAGKDHSVKGGAYDTGIELCQEIFGYQGPVKVPYEWLRLGDRDMKTSKGIVFTPREYLKIADPEVFRMIILRTNPMKHISFRIEEITQYYDYFERMERVYYDIENVESEEEKEFLTYLYPLTIINGIPEKKPKRIPLNLLIFLSQVQNILSLDKLYDKARSVVRNNNFEENISMDDFKILLQHTENWINEIKKIIDKEENKKIKKSLKQKISLFEIPDNINSNILESLDKKQLNGIESLRDFIKKNDNLDEDSIQNKIFIIAKEDLEIPPKKLFQALYLIILGKRYGPRLGSFLTMLDKNWLLERLDISKI
ncbi:MAG: lysine--tRNA ligase [Promethearchaeota archaeon]|nr:MAG: lysine--tRNA ligase [Candidatus Lokiarchaeota archaeon]